MITFTDITVNHFARNALRIEWAYDVEDGDNSTLYSFRIERSESRTDGFESIMNVEENSRNFTDYSVNTLSKERVYFYKIVAELITDSSVSFESKIGYISSLPDCIALEIVRKNRLLLRQYMKTKCYLYASRSVGQRCSNCWNPITGTVTLKNCPVCHGTGFEKGLYKPEPVYIDFDPDPSVLRISGLGPIEGKDTGAWTSNYPIIRSNDYIREVETGDIWKVEDKSPIKKNRFLVSQALRISEVQRGSQMYDFEIPDVWVEPWSCTYLSGVQYEDMP